MLDNKLTDNEIIEALEDWIKNYDGSYINFKILGNVLDLINHQKAIIEKSEKVEHFADKTIATANARIEELVGNNDKLNIELQSMRSAANSLKMHYEEAQAEVERLKTNLNVELENFATEYDNKIKAEAYKECIEKVKEKSKKTEVVCSGALITTNYAISAKNLNNLLKELVGDSNETVL